MLLYICQYALFESVNLASVESLRQLLAFDGLYFLSPLKEHHLEVEIIVLKIAKAYQNEIIGPLFQSLF